MGVATEVARAKTLCHVDNPMGMLITILVQGTHCHVIYLDISHIFRIFKGGWVGEVVQCLNNP